MPPSTRSSTSIAQPSPSQEVNEPRAWVPMDSWKWELTAKGWSDMRVHSVVSWSDPGPHRLSHLGALTPC